MMEAARTSETSVDNCFTRQYIPEDNSELHTRRRENLKSHTKYTFCRFVTISELRRFNVGVAFIIANVDFTKWKQFVEICQLSSLFGMKDGKKFCPS
jgi:hypothetical protein